MSYIMVVVLIIIALLLGMVFGYVTKSAFTKAKLYDGVLKVIKKDDGGLTYSIEIISDLEELQFMDELVLRVEDSE